jgi:hypothetical protein
VTIRDRRRLATNLKLKFVEQERPLEICKFTLRDRVKFILEIEFYVTICNWRLGPGPGRLIRFALSVE